ncbi:acetyl esterase/lipase [Pedobacter sp. UYP30]|uniref:alpha/beta hydrolase n=1 Tax=Pedobacter sp. UYP30 TaxID=1756400 RepID=UPI00339AECAF
MQKFFGVVVLIFFSLVGSAQVKKVKNLNYAGNTSESNTLNIYYKNDGIKDKPVLIFIHGGSWSSGKKETYWWLGRNFARKGVVTAIINYPLAPNVQYEKMGDDCALAVKWVKENIADYQASPDKIFVMGHSAGGHLAALINADPKYFEHVGIKNPIKGLILDDPFGLDMHQYLTEANKDDFYFEFIRTFTTKPSVWTMASPMHYLENIKNPQLLFYGSKTYPAIKLQTPEYARKLKANGIDVSITEVKGKSHIPMISQMIFGCNVLYKDIVTFISHVSST